MIKKIVLICSVITLSTAMRAQQIKVPVGTKFQLLSTVNTTVAISSMGQDMEITSSGKIVQEFAVNTISANGYSLLFSVKKISGGTSVMGQEQNFDSDDSTMRNLPGMDQVLNMLNKQEEIKVENGIMIGEIKSLKNIPGISNNSSSDNFTKLFLSIPESQMKEGSRWADSTINENIHSVNQYTITHITTEQVEMDVISDSKISTTVSQGGIDVKTDMKGQTKSTRIYNLSKRILVSEKSTSEMTGTAEANGMSTPMNIKVIGSSLVI